MWSSLRSPRSWTVVGLVVATLFTALFATGLFTISQDRHPLSVVDEHIHFDTAAVAVDGIIPFRGSLLSDALVQEWACGVGHEGGGTLVPCGDPKLDASAIPSGKYSTGYIHYPTYFFLAASFQPVWEALTGDAGLLSAFRAFSALCMTLGVIASGTMAWLLGLRGSRMLAALSIPVATSMIVVLGVNVNPASTTVLTGALVAGTGLLWVRRNRGFVWFALAGALSSAVAVTSSLPLGGFLLAMLAVLVVRRFRPDFATGWTPRWWQFILTSLIVLVPVFAWGRVIAARATITNAELYGFLPPSGRKDIIVGATRELATLHTPWRETMGIKAQPDAFLAQVVNAVSGGAPTWITAIVFGGLVLASLGLLWRRLPSTAQLDIAPLALPGDTDRASAAVSGTHLVAIGSLVTVILYPPALRISNWLNFGFDFAIVERYSSALAPVLIISLLLLVRSVTLSRILAVIGILTALGTVAGAA
ncbi:MAG: hypothetical protein ACRDT7_10800 [Microbacterium sp.]